MSNRTFRMTWLVARREIVQRGGTRAFAITTFILIIAVALGVALPAMVLLAAATVWMARVAAGIYSRSILRTGARVRLNEVLRRASASA